MIFHPYPGRQGRLVVASAFLALGVHAALVGVAWWAPATVVAPLPTPLDVRLIEEAAPQALPAPRQTAVPPPQAAPEPPKPPKPEPKPEPKPRPKPKPVARPVPAPTPTLVAEAPESPQIPEAPPARAVTAPAAVPAAPAEPVSVSPPVAVAAAPVAAAVVAPRFDAAYLANPPPVYPHLSRRLGEEGRVLLRVHVEPDGRPSRIEMRDSSGYSRLDSAALGAVRNWRFVPAKRGSEAVAAWVLVPINFTLKNS